MKQVIILLLGVGFATFYLSCNKENNSLPLNQEELLIEQITATPNVEAVSVMDLPSVIFGYVTENHSPFEIDLAFRAEQHGFEVFLEDGLCLYFDQKGNHLNHDGIHGDIGNHHGGGDHGINFCLAGDTLDVASLPQEIIDHVVANHVGAHVVTVVLKPSGNLAVEISAGDMLMFGPNGDYYQDCDMQATGGHGHGHGNIGSPGWHCDPDGGMGGGHGGQMGHGNHGGMDNHSGSDEPCWGGTSISIDNLPTTSTTYINTNHADATIEHIMQTFNSNYFIRLSNCARLVFDANGNILFDGGD